MRASSNNSYLVLSLLRIQKVIKFLESKKVWPNQWSKIGDFAPEGIEKFPPAWLGSHVDKAGPLFSHAEVDVNIACLPPLLTQVANYVGNVADLGWSMSLMGDALTFPTISQILESAKYWWEGERLYSAYMCIQCYASQDTCRGELKVAEDVTKLMAFIYFFGVCHGFQLDEEAESSPFAKDHVL